MHSNSPNILFITCDQLRKDALGCYGNPAIHTPNIDSLAARGVCFQQMYVASPACSPSRASISTGRFPFTHGLRINGVSLPEREVTFMEALRQHGYATYLAGKLHFHPQWDYRPEEVEDLVFRPDTGRAINPQPTIFPHYGLERCDIVEDNNAGPYSEYLGRLGLDPWKDAHSFSYPQHQCGTSSVPVEHSKTSWIADRTLDFLRSRDTKKPFFAWASFVAPHHPFIVPAGFDTMYNPADMPLPRYSADEVMKWPAAYQKHFYAETGSHEAVGMHKLGEADWQKIAAYYYGAITHIDQQIGRLIDELKASGEWENTIVFFLSDHGELLGEHRLLFKVALFDGVTNIPFIVSGPGIPAGWQAGGLASAVDIAPTVLEMAGITPLSGMQGESLCPVISGREPNRSREFIYLESTGAARMVRTANARLTWHGRSETGELYDLHSDPDSLVNLWNDPQARKMQSEMMDILVHALVAYSDPLPERKLLC